MNIILASFGRKFITDLIELIGLTRPKFDISPTGDLNFIQVDPNKIESGASHEKFDICPKPNKAVILPKGQT